VVLVESVPLPRTELSRLVKTSSGLDWLDDELYADSAALDEELLLVESVLLVLPLEEACAGGGGGAEPFAGLMSTMSPVVEAVVNLSARLFKASACPVSPLSVALSAAVLSLSAISAVIFLYCVGSDSCRLCNCFMKSASFEISVESAVDEVAVACDVAVDEEVEPMLPIWLAESRLDKELIVMLTLSDQTAALVPHNGSKNVKKC